MVFKRTTTYETYDYRNTLLVLGSRLTMKIYQELLWKKSLPWKQDSETAGM